MRALRFIAGLFATLPMLAVLYLTAVEEWAFPALFDAQYTLRFWSGLLRADSELTGSLFLSLFVSTTEAAVATAFGFLVSKAVLFDRKGEGLLRLALFPFLIAPPVLGAMLQFYFVRWGLTGKLSGVMLAQALFVLPYGTLLMSGFWTERVRQVAFQAYSLGASARQVSRYVLLPMARGWLALTFGLCFLASWFEYGVTRLIGVGKVGTLTVRAMQYVQEASPHQAALSACLMVAPLLVLLPVFRRVALWGSER